MTQYRITSAQFGRLTDGRDPRAAHAIEQAAHGISTAEAAIRTAAAAISARLAETTRRLDHGLGLNDLGELQRAPADFDRAVIVREHHGKVLGALLTDAEIAALQPAATPAP